MHLSSGLKNFIILTVPFILAELSIQSVAILSVFLVLDVITGIISSVRVYGTGKLNSKTFSFGILFKFLILFIPIIVVWTGKGIGLDLLMFAVWAINMLIVSEALSIIGNISTIKTGEPVKEIDAVNIILGKFKKILMSFLQRDDEK